MICRSTDLKPTKNRLEFDHGTTRLGDIKKEIPTSTSYYCSNKIKDTIRICHFLCRLAILNSILMNYRPASVPFCSLVPVTLTDSVGSGLSIGGSGLSSILLSADSLVSLCLFSGSLLMPFFWRH